MRFHWCFAVVSLIMVSGFSQISPLYADVVFEHTVRWWREGDRACRVFNRIVSATLEHSGLKGRLKRAIRQWSTVS